MNGLLQDLRYALRRLRKCPGFTAIVVSVLALGVGANTAVFSVINAALLRPLPYKDADRLVMIWQQNPHRGWFENNVSGANFLDWQKQNHVFTGVAAFESTTFNLSGDSKPEEVSGQRVTTNLFSILEVQPLRGRLFLPEEEHTEKAAVILSYALWKQHFGGNSDVVGKRISLNGQSYPVVGILPAHFDDLYTTRFTEHTQFWISGIAPFPPEREFHEYRALARLKPGVTLAQAQAEMSTIAAGIEQEYPESRGWGVAVVDLHDQVVHYTRPALLILLAVVALVLLIACANVANLFLVRATGREKETAIRASLGANRSQLVRQFLVESTLLATVGAAAGLALASYASQVLLRLAPPETPRIEGAGINALVLLFTFSVALMTGVVVGVLPAFGASQLDVHESLKASAHGLSSGKSRKLRDVLVVCELGLALAVLVSAGLMIKALAHLHKVDIGFNPNHVLSAEVPLKGPHYNDTERQVDFFQELIEHIEAIPGVIAASVSRGVPMAGWAGWNFVTADNPNPPAGDVPDANYVVIGPDYFKTMQIPLREGRPFVASDTPRSQSVAIVSQSLAQKYWPGEDAIGKRLKVSGDAHDESQPWLTIVGIAGNVRTEGQYALFLPEIYVPYTQYPWVLSPRNILVRASGDPLRIVPEIRRAVAMLDKDVPLSEITAMQQIVAGPMQQGQTIMWLLEGFAGLALLLTAMGIYSVISYAVAQRTHEIGIRVALGATRGDVSGLVVKHGSILAAIGVAAGLCAAFAITRALLSLPFQVRWLLLFDVRPTDPLIIGAVCAILGGIALLASFVPARRAARIDPLVALRYE